MTYEEQTLKENAELRASLQSERAKTTALVRLVEKGFREAHALCTLVSTQRYPEYDGWQNGDWLESDAKKALDQIAGGA